MIKILEKNSNISQNRAASLKILRKVTSKYNIDPEVRNMVEFLLSIPKWNTSPKIRFQAAWDLAVTYHYARREKELRFFRFSYNDVNLIRFYRNKFKLYFLTAGYQRDAEQKIFWYLSQDVSLKRLIQKIKRARSWLYFPVRYHLSFNPKIACAQGVMFEFPRLLNYILLRHLSRILGISKRDLILAFLTAFENFHVDWRQIIKQDNKKYCLGDKSLVIKPGDHLSLNRFSNSNCTVLIEEWEKFRYNNEIISPKKWLLNAGVSYDNPLEGNPYVFHIESGASLKEIKKLGVYLNYLIQTEENPKNSAAN